MEINKMAFVEFRDTLQDGEEGIVLLGAGGELQEWVNGIFEALKEENITIVSEPTELFSDAIELTTTGGRTDLALIFTNFDNFNMGKMAMWKLRFGDCSWISDYLVNYSKHHGIEYIGNDNFDENEEQD